MDLHAIAARRLLLPVARYKEGRRHFNRFLREFMRNQYLSPGELRDLQLRRLKALLRHSYEHTPFYRRQFQEAGITPDAIRDLDDLRLLPTLSKQQIQAHLDELIADTHAVHRLRRDYTGGSTGTALMFYRDFRRGDAREALAYRHDGWTGWEIGERQSFIWGAPRDLGPVGQLRWRLTSRFVRRYTMLDALALDEESMSAFATDLTRWRPSLIVTFATAAYVFAKFLLARGIEVPRPKGIITTAELLQPHQRRAIEEGFRAPVFDRYGAREVGLVASECESHEGMHIAADSVQVEFLVDGRPAEPGEPGEIVVTDLLNYGMPMIRYRLGDVGVPTDRRCSCGRTLPMMEMLSGRVTDFLVTPNGKMLWGAYITLYAIAHRPGFEQVQLIQDARDRVLIKVVPGPQFARADLDYVGQRLGELMGGGVTFTYELVDEIPVGPGGKRQFCVCKVPTALSEDVLVERT